MQPHRLPLSTDPLPESISGEIISLFLSSPPGERDLARCKIEICRRYNLPAVPKNSAILASLPEEKREEFRRLLLVKPGRTLSGVAPIAVMTSPAPCPHGICLPCPGGPEHPFRSPQSYTGEEPAALRAREHEYDPYRQVTARLSQFEALGHRVGKAELIVMGGTMTSRPLTYQEEFVTGCLRAMNEYGGGLPSPRDLAGAAAANETSGVRCVAMTFETRPDWCRLLQVREMLRLGVTKVELGVQHLDDAILALNRRGCTVTDTIAANTLLRDTGLKVGFHIMPNLPGSTPERDLDMVRRLFSDPSFRPDFLKIYPTLVTPGSEIESLFRQGEYEPYPEETMVALIARMKALLPEYVRLQRIQRDIPARLIVAGSRHSNFRQLAKDRLEADGGACRCIRCREVGRAPGGTETASRELSYPCCGGTEHFLSEEAGDALTGFTRLRVAGSRTEPGTENASFLRELHVYGPLVPVGATPSGREAQHRRTGARLLGRAEELAREQGYDLLVVMSGIGVRPWYRRHGYHRAGPYMVKDLR